MLLLYVGEEEGREKKKKKKERREKRAKGSRKGKGESKTRKNTPRPRIHRPELNKIGRIGDWRRAEATLILLCWD